MSTSPDLDSIRGRFTDWLAALDSEFIEREAAVRLACLGPFANQHVLLLGEPGTAKSQLAQRVSRLVGGRLFSTLLTRFSVPEDVFGPHSLAALEQGRYERLTDSYLPTAEIAFIDEIYKANASILNAMLSILNEHKFFNGSKAEAVPLLSLVAASNEVPDDSDGLDALDDRLLLRICVEPIQDHAAFGRLLSRPMGSQEIAMPPAFTAAEIHALQAQAARVAVDDPLVEVLLDVRRFCREQKLKVSDRRWRQIVEVAKTCAALDGEEQVKPRHLGVLRYSLWRRPSDQQKVIQAMAAVVRSLNTVTATIRDLEQNLTDVKKRLDEFQSTSSGYYGRIDESSTVETLHKLKTTVAAAREGEVALRAALGADTPSWSPFWKDAVEAVSMAPAIATIEAHPFIKETLPNRFPQILSQAKIKVKSSKELRP